MSRSRYSAWVAALLLLFQNSAQADNEIKYQEHFWEVGVFAGASFFGKEHSIFDASESHKFYNDNAPTFGARVAYLPRPWFGLELEGEASPTKAAGQDAMRYAVGAHALLQVPARFAPFVLAGAVLQGVRSDPGVLGNDIDPAFRWGVGLKYYAHRNFALRVDARQSIGIGYPNRLENDFAILGGLSLVLGTKALVDSDKDGLLDPDDRCPNEPAKTKDGCPPPDRDSDGVPDAADQCPDQAAPGEANGCPPPDSDGDGIIDRDDRCPKEAAKTKDGCPIPDADGDGVPDAQDKCPDVAAKTPTGCPLDSDGDGIIDEKDRCPREPETRNGYQDDDGCADELPKAVLRFTGTIGGIQFARGKAKIRPSSFAILNAAANVLKAYPDLKIAIRGHTDNTGSRERNLELSRQRAEAVRDYLVSKEIASERLTVQAIGPDEPVADNKRSSGRRKNRRIEFRPMQ